MFPTKGNSTPSDTLTSLNPSKHPYFPLKVTLFPSFPNLLFLSFFSLFLSRVANPHSLLNPHIYSMRFVQFHDCIMVSLVWVGSDVIIPNMEYILLETVVVALELIFASKRLLGSNTPQGNTEPPERYVVLGIRNLEQTINSWTWDYLSCTQKQYGLIMRFGPSFDS